MEFLWKNMSPRRKEICDFIYYLIAVKYITEDGKIKKIEFQNELIKAKNKNLLLWVDNNLDKLTQRLFGLQLIIKSNDSNDSNSYLFPKDFLQKLKETKRFSESNIYRKMISLNDSNNDIKNSNHNSNNSSLPSTPSKSRSQSIMSLRSDISIGSAEIRKIELYDFVYYLIHKNLIGNDRKINRNILLQEFRQVKNAFLLKNIDSSKIISHLYGEPICVYSDDPDVFLFTKKAIDKIRNRKSSFHNTEIYKKMISKKAIGEKANGLKTPTSIENQKLRIKSIEVEPINGRKTPIKVEPINGRKTPIKVEPINGRKTPIKVEPINGRKTPIKVEPINGRKTPIKIEPINGMRTPPKIEKVNGFETPPQINSRQICCIEQIHGLKTMQQINSSPNYCANEMDEIDTTFQELTVNEFESKDNETIIKHCATYKRIHDRDFYITTKCCIICRLNFTNEKEFCDHLVLHEKKTIQLDLINLNVETLPYFELKFDFNLISSDIEFTLICLKDIHIINKIVLYHPYHLVITLSTELWPAPIHKGEEIKFHADRDLFTKINFKYPIVIHFFNSHDIVEKHEMIVNKLFPPILKFDFSLEIEKNAIKRREKSLKLHSLKTYPPSKDLKFLFSNKFTMVENMTDQQYDLLKEFKNLDTMNRDERLNPTNYSKVLTNLVQLEDLQCELDMYLYDKTDQILYFRNGYYVVAIDDLLEHRPSLMDGDSLYILPMTCPDLEMNRARRTYGFILRVEQTAIVIDFSKEKKSNVDLHQKYRIHFLPNRLNCQMEQQALEIIKISEISKFFFPTTITEKNISDIEFDWFNNNIQNNPEQQQAIKNILHGTAYPAPYLLFGPPGTGKTMTLVETIAQLWRNQPTSRMLVTAPSNSACDEIAIRLLDYIISEDVIRIFAANKERDIEKMHVDLLEISNLDSGMHSYPPLELLYKYRIVLTTLTVAGRLVQARIEPNHFTHVFIDECGSATEPSALVSISGMITSGGKLNGQVILAGDPQQLGPILQSKIADSLGLSQSLLERLMRLPLYQKDPVTKKYNPKVLTKLVRNFRSHSSILKLPSKLFYDNELIPVGSKETTQWAINWKFLQNRNFPVLFRSVSGRPMQDKNSPSWYNNEEVEFVIKYAVELIINGINGRIVRQSDIGIISPYKRQCTKIRLDLERRKIKDIEVSSVEAFQGKEKPIIILSTVRSNMRSIGFLNNPKRMNVALTRAQALLIIVGDPKVLQKDPYWLALIEYCIVNRAFVGRDFSLQKH